MSAQLSIIHEDSDVYNSLIEQFLARTFPVALAPSLSSDALIDALTEEIVGTKQVRNGPRPSPETLVAIRDVLRFHVGNESPIPFMVPWGSRKPDGSSLDIAEFSAAKMMANLDSRVTALYRPGTLFRIRFEDVSAPYLYADDFDKVWNQSRQYAIDFEAMIHLLGLNTFIKSAPESDLVSLKDFGSKVSDLLPVFSRALSTYDMQLDDAKLRKAAEDSLAEVGWKGGLNHETADFYLRQYEKLYPERSRHENLMTLARYFTNALARHHLKIRGDRPEWQGKFIDFALIPPIPGTAAMFNRRVHYRTLPLNATSNHLAPWRAKGYLEVSENNAVHPKLATFHQLKDGSLTLTPHCLKLTEGNLSVKVRTDYVLV